MPTSGETIPANSMSNHALTKKKGPAETSLKNVPTVSPPAPTGVIGASLPRLQPRPQKRRSCTGPTVEHGQRGRTGSKRGEVSVGRVFRYAVDYRFAPVWAPFGFLPWRDAVRVTDD